VPHSLEGLLILALLLPLAVVGVALAFNWTMVRSQRIKRRNQVVLFVVLGAVYGVFGVVELTAGARHLHGILFLILGVGWVVYALWQRRSWREDLDEPVGTGMLP